MKEIFVLSKYNNIICASEDEKFIKTLEGALSAEVHTCNLISENGDENLDKLIKEIYDLYEKGKLLDPSYYLKDEEGNLYKLEETSKEILEQKQNNESQIRSKRNEIFDILQGKKK